MGEEEITSLRLRVVGRVQGVGFRYFALSEAQRRGLDGWVRNLTDGTVEVLASGPNAAVEAFVTACMRGPSSARVDNVEMALADPPARKGFVQLPTF